MRERAPNYKYLALCVYQLMGEMGGILGLLCRCVCVTVELVFYLSTIVLSSLIIISFTNYGSFSPQCI
jgi:hypothetical protein